MPNVADDLESLFEDEESEEIRPPSSQHERKKKESEVLQVSEIEEEELEVLFEDEPLVQEQADHIPTMLCPSPIHILPIKKNVYQDLMLMAKAVNELASSQFEESLEFEVYCYLLCDKESFKEDEPSIVTEIFIPPHSAQEGHVDVNHEGVLALKDYIEDNELMVLGWAHSHGQHDAYSSQTDDANHRMILAETSNYIKHNEFDLKYIYEITVNTREDHYGVILTQYPCAHIAQENECDLDIQGEGYDEFEKEERYNQIKGMVRSKVNLIKPADQLSPEEIKKKIGEEIMANFVNKLFISKNLLADQLSGEEEENFEMIRTVLEKYDNLIADSAEEAVSQTSDTLIRLMQNLRKDI